MIEVLKLKFLMLSVILWIVLCILCRSCLLFVFVCLLLVVVFVVMW